VGRDRSSLRSDVPARSTAVTGPTERIHPAIAAQASATAAVQLGGGFVLGVGSGEALNEHILGDPSPSAGVRLEMLEEAVGVIRALHTGENISHHGTHYEVSDARIYTSRGARSDLRFRIRAAGSGTGRNEGELGPRCRRSTEGCSPTVGQRAAARPAGADPAPSPRTSPKR
jgi:G6PDH family F420-dependent oxidoreductase